MKGQGSYVPPPYIPLDQLDTEANSTPVNNGFSSHQSATRDLTQWSSGICACFDDMQSCCVGAVCPCFLFGKNAEFLGSGTLAGSCMTHFILWGLVNSLCCLFTGGLLAAVPGSMVACYACGYRKTLRAKYNLQDSYTCSEVRNNFWCARCFAGHGTEVMLNHMVVHIGEELRLEAPCGDLTTHLFCHLCAICQEYREIRERSSGSDPSMMSSAVAAPAVQTMELAPHE